MVSAILGHLSGQVYHACAAKGRTGERAWLRLKYEVFKDPTSQTLVQLGAGASPLRVALAPGCAMWAPRLVWRLRVEWLRGAPYMVLARGLGVRRGDCGPFA